MQKQQKIKILFCLNDRGEGKQSCAASGADALRRYAKTKTGDERIKVKKSECLGLCKHGPVIQILPAKLYYQCTTEADIDLILTQASVASVTSDGGIAGNASDSLLIKTGKAAKKSKQEKR